MKEASMSTRKAAASPTAAAARDGAEAPVFQRVRVRRAFEAVCDQIRLQVANGTLQPGHRLPSERELAEQFNISRSGVREALRSLELAGIVEARTGVYGGVFISSGDSGGIAQAVHDVVSLGRMPTESVTEARIELTCVAIRLACKRATPAELDAIEADIEHMAALFRQGKGLRNTRSLGEFYRLLARATHNDVIVMLVDALSEVVRTLLAQIDPAPRTDIVEVRRKVLRQMRAGDAARACATMTQHFEHLNSYLEVQSREKKKPAPAPAPVRTGRAAARPSLKS